LHVRNHGDRPARRHWLAIVIPIVLLAGGAVAGIPAAVLAVAPAAASTSVSSHFAYACGATLTPGKATCLLIKNTAAHPSAQTVRSDAIPAGNGYGPSELQSAYNLTSASAADGAGTTVAVVDAYNDPTAVSDAAVYRAAAGLPALTPGQLTVYNEDGQTSPLPAEAPAAANGDWTEEESLDVDMVSAICPLCNIDLVEANSTGLDDMFTADQSAATILGAKYVSDSWGTPEATGEPTIDSEVFSTPGVVYLAAASDTGYGNGVINYPAASPNVVSVGGTTLATADNSRGWTESVWNTLSDAAGAGATGSGCSEFEAQPSWQKSIPIISSACPNRVANDVAADADPSTGAAVYDTSDGNTGWFEAGGTSESTPLIAAVFALADNDGNGGNNAADSIYTHTSDLNEVTASNNGACTESVLCTATGAADTYNGPTGWGTPDGITGFESNSAAADTVTVTSPGTQTGTVGTPASLQVNATDSATGQTLTYSATGLPAGLSISSSGLISGTPTTAATSSVQVTATDTTGAFGSTSFTWTISAAAINSGNTVTVTNPGTQVGIAGTAAASVQISATDSDSSQTLTYTAAGLPPGLSISSAGLISGTPTTPGIGRVVVTATDTTGASGTAAFIWAIGLPVGSGGSVSNTITVISPGNQAGTVGTAASLQISATDSDSSQTLSYIALSLPPGLSINASTGLISGTPAIAGTSDVGIIVSDNTGAAISTSFTWTISAGATAATCTARQLLGNPGFDTGSIKPWSSTAGVLAKSKRGVRAQAGSWLARLDGYGAAHKDTLAQTVTIPAACKNAVFSYWVEVHSTVTNKAQQAKNTLVLNVLNASGKVLKTVLVATAANHGTKYVKHTINLASYAGQTITVKFTGTEVSGGSTSFLEDSNALNS
jgi:hypothetical protein